MPGKHVYWDSCVPLSFIDADQADRHPAIRWWLDEASKIEPAFELVTSTLSLTEVAFGAKEKLRGVLDPAVEQGIDKLWYPDGPIRLYEYHEGVARRARDLMRVAVTRRWSLKAPDAIHLATAQTVGANELHTYDKRLFRWAPILGFPIRVPQTLTPKLGL